MTKVEDWRWNELKKRITEDIPINDRIRKQARKNYLDATRYTYSGKNLALERVLAWMKELEHLGSV